MNLKSNINKIHSDIILNYEDVKIEEKSSLEFGEFVEITAVNENKKLVLIVSKRDLDSDTFNWRYYSNPNQKNHLVERTSSVNNMIKDIKDIFEKNRFDSDYISSL